jgi:hypothetical protein
MENFITYLQNYGLNLLEILLLSAMLYLVQKYGKSTLKNTINTLIQMAEEAIQGSGLGEEKKAWVIKQLESTGIKVTDAVSKLIDELVEVMNKEKTSLIDVIK